MPNKLSQFWHELKRRKVIHVITVYAGAAFVIIELVNNITEPLRLPEWTPTLVIILLLIGFPIAAIFSWIYDIHPEEGLVKTEPADKVTKEDKPKSSKGWKIASYFSFVVIVGLIVLNILPRTDRKEIPDKSIAILPFRNDSPDKENAYFINGTMESILNNLSRIKDLRAISRSSVEKYRDSAVSVPDVAKELMVSYVLEGSMQKYGNHIRLTLQLINRNDSHVWSEQYDREIQKVEDYLSLQSEIASLVAGELQALITPEEQLLMEKVPTTNLSAYDLYLLGNQYLNTDKTETGLLKAIDLFESAIALDPEFAPPYEGIGWAYRNLVWYANWLPAEAFKRSREAVLKALQIDEQLAGAHELLGTISYEFDWDLKASETELIRAIELNPNEASAYRNLWDLYVASGRFSVAHQYIQQAVRLDPNNRIYQSELGESYYFVGEIDSALQYLEERGPSNRLGQFYLEIGENEKTIEVYEELLKHASQEAYFRTWLGIAYYRVGMKEKTREQLEIIDSLEGENSSVSFYRAALLAELGQSDSAFYWLQKTYEERNQMLFYYKAYKSPFASMRSDPRFLELVDRLPSLK
jgi:TolB-like protein/Flp pilus assembly protein TadD